MDRRISEIFDYGDGIAVVEERDDLFDSARIKELTMKKINENALREEGKKIVKRTRPVWRTALIAAVIVLALSAAALAVYQYGLGDMVLSERDDGVVDVSVLGWRDTPEYQAYTEWEAFVEEYEADHEIPDVKFDGSYPIEYLRVGAATPEMMEALDGILEKYSLTLHDEAMIILPAEGSGIDVGAILPAAEGYPGGYAYRDGTMMLEADQILADGETVEYQLFSAVKGTFTDIYGGMDREYEEWAYTAADGTEVDLVMGETCSMIVADMDRAFATLHTVFHNVSGREALEALADSVRWRELDVCRGFSDEFYAAYSAARAAEAEEMELAIAAELELKDWMLSEDIIRTHIPDNQGWSAADSEDGAAWVEWTYTDLEDDGVIRVRYERPAGDIRAAFEAQLAQAGDAYAPRTLKEVPVHVRAESPAGADYATENRDFTVYIGEEEGATAALWLDEDKDLIFTLAADPGELTEDEMISQIKYLLGGQEPYPMQVAPEVVWAKLGHYEPAWLPEGWYLAPEMQTALSLTENGVWTGRMDQAYITGEVGDIIWFSYETAPSGDASREAMVKAFGYGTEVLDDPTFLFTDTTVNGHPALRKETPASRGVVLIWIDEEAGVLFTLCDEASADAETIRAMAESVTAR